MPPQHAIWRRAADCPAVATTTGTRADEEGSCRACGARGDSAALETSLRQCPQHRRMAKPVPDCASRHADVAHHLPAANQQRAGRRHIAASGSRAPAAVGDSHVRSARSAVCIPEFSWPYGRVVAIEEAPTASRQDRVQIRRNVEQAIRIVNDLDVVVDEWTAPNGNGLLH